MSNFKITKREFYLALAFAILGFLFTTKSFLLFLNSLDPIKGLGVYYVLIFSTIFILSKMGLTAFNIKIERYWQVIGMTLIVFAFFILVNWENAYISYVLSGSVDAVPNIFLGSEDGATFYFWNTIVGVTDILFTRILTFIVTPFVLAILGGLLVEKKPSII